VNHNISTVMLEKITPKISAVSDFAYRADLDGLRAIAIILVMLEHIYDNFGLFHGCLGVDIFFVLSGYLITRIVVKDLDHGTFRFADFYARRIRRLFPTLIVTFLGFFAVGMVFLNAHGFRLLSATVVSSGLSLSNYALSSGMAFFQVNPRILPFSHLWSLALEEQFYLVFPWIIVGMNRFSGLKKWCVPLLVVLGIASWHYWYVGRKLIGITYYSPLARSWELLIGVILAWSWSNKDIWQMRATRFFSNVARYVSDWRMGVASLVVWAAGLAGVGAVLGLMAVVDRAKKILARRQDRQDLYARQGEPCVINAQAQNPINVSMWLSNLGITLVLLGLFSPMDCSRCVCAIFATLGTAAIIAAGPDTWLGRYVLSRPLMVYIGRLSYALYVVHYPVLVIWGLMRGKVVQDADTLAMVVLVSFILAVAIYHGVEQKTRRAPYVWPWVAAMLVCIAIGCAGYFKYIPLLEKSI